MSKRPAAASRIAILRSSLCFLFVLFSFTIFAQPTISSFSPTSGPVGTAVTINGSGFNATAGNNLVFFGPVKATVTSASATQLVVSVPAGAGPQPFTVTTGGLTAFAAKPFLLGIPGMDAVSASGITNARGGTTLSWNSPKTALAITDLNGDGKPDLLAGMSTGSMSQYNNTSTAGTVVLTRAGGPDIPTGAAPYPVADIISSDLDGDGIAEIITAAEGNDQLAIFSNTMAQLTTLGVRSGPNSLAIADVDKDGKPDIIVGCYRSGSLRIFRNTSTIGALSFVSLSIISGFIAKLAVADLDGDGKPDIAGVYPENNTSNPVQKVNLLQNTSTGPGNVNFTLSTFVLNAVPGNIQLGDLDGDNHSDMVVSYPAAGKVTVYHNQSTGSISFDAGTDITTTGAPGAIAIADLDADAKPEIIVGNTTGNSVDVLKNNSATNAFSFNRVNISASMPANSVLVNDFDGDGKNDIAIGALNTTSIEVLRNVISEPEITSFTPTGTLAGGTVTIQGSYLASATEVSFGGIPATSFVVNPDGSITATVGTGASGLVVVKTPFGSAWLGGYVFYRGLPTFTSFIPARAATGGIVVITGTNLNNITSVSFGGVAASSFFSNSAGTSITATVGAGATGVIKLGHPLGNVSKPGFTYEPSPTVTSFSPTSGKTGDEIIITGNNFINSQGQGNVYNVALGGMIAYPLTYISNTQIKVIVGSGATGDVKVSTTAGNFILRGFTYLEPPTITSFSPASGKTGDEIIITGNNLRGNVTDVIFGGIPCATFRFISNTEMAATISTGASGDVVVATQGGNVVLPGFTYFAPPFISSFAPMTGFSGGVVTFTGNNFTGTTAVSFGGTPAASFRVVDDHTITATVANGASGDILVTALGGTGRGLGFIYMPPPVITSFTPVTGVVGNLITITGSGFMGATAVSFGGMAARGFTVVNDNVITATLSNGTSGDVQVTTPYGTHSLAGFTYQPPPVVTGFTPASATAGQTLTITGHNFTNATSVSIGGQPTTSFTLVNDSTITLVLGTVRSGTVGVTTPAGYGSLGGFVYDFFTLPTLAPGIFSFSPLTAGPGERIIITGEHLDNATSVTLGGMPVRSFTVTSSSNIWAYVDTGRSGTVTVTTPIGTATLDGFIFWELGNQMIIYPNPIDNRTMFWVKHRAEQSLKWICIFDNTGKVVRTVPVQPGNNLTQVFAGGLKSGYYHVAILGSLYKQAATLMVR